MSRTAVKHPPAYLSALALVCAAGDGLSSVMANLRKGASPGMAATDRWIPGVKLTVGEVTVPLPSLDAFAPEHRTRNNRLALHTSRRIQMEIESAISDFGAHRVAVVAGTTTSGIEEAESAFRFAKNRGAFPEDFAYAQMELGSPAEFLALAWGLKGPAYTVSTACSSSAKAMASARRLLRLGVCDAVLVGGVDTLCGFTLRGFSALGALSSDPALPFSLNRKGINIGEAAAFFMMRRDRGPVILLGAGETSDAHNISAPLPGGEGARAAMAAALRDGGIEAAAVDYVNLHGTGTEQNDAMEARAMNEVFPGGVPCSSTKPSTGHTLGAAGALEAGLCWGLLAGFSEDGWLPAHINDGVIDPAIIPLDLVRVDRAPKSPPRLVLSNVFGFGGTNVSLLLGAA